jgi:hypothetical protein
MAALIKNAHQVALLNVFHVSIVEIQRKGYRPQEKDFGKWPLSVFR